VIARINPSPSTKRFTLSSPQSEVGERHGPLVAIGLAMDDVANETDRSHARPPAENIECELAGGCPSVLI